MDLAITMDQSTKNKGRKIFIMTSITPFRFNLNKFFHLTFMIKIFLVVNFQGARDVLKTVGYKEESVQGLCFTKNALPDQLKIAFAITELMLGLAEIEQYSTGQANYPVHLDSLIPPVARYL